MIKVEAIIRKKVLSHDFSNSLIRRSLAKNGSILIEQFPAVLAIADKAVRAAEPIMVEFGVHLYCCAFSVFPDIFNRQNLISNVLSHVGSSTSDSECGAGLNILVKLAEDAEQLKELWQFVETVLDNLASLSKTNLRKAWKMFTALIFKGPRGGVLDEKVYNPLCMVLRKQLTNVRDAYKRSGVVGAAAMISQLSAAVLPGGAAGANRKQQPQQAHQQRDKAVSAELMKEFDYHVKALFHIGEPFYLALAFDELALALQMVPSSHVSMIERIQLAALEVFETFVSDCTDKTDLVEGAEVMLNLNGPDTLNAINFWKFSSSKDRDKLVYLCPVLNLLQACMHKTSDSLNDLGALSGAPLLLFPPNYLETFEDVTEVEQTRVVFSLFHAIGWIRECLNTFCVEKDAAKDNLLLQRLTHMYFLEAHLEKCLRIRPCSLPNLRDPTGALCAASNAVAAEPIKKKAKAAVAGGAKKKKDGDEDGGEAGGASISDNGVDLPRVRLLSSSFRSLNLTVCCLFDFPSPSEDTDGCVVLRPFAVHALLQNLDEYCQQLFEPHLKRPSPFGRKPKEIDLGLFADPKSALSNVIMRIVPALAENLSRLGSFIANWVNSNGTSWVHASGEAADFNSVPPFDHDALELDENEERQRHVFWWFIMPSQRLIFDIFTRIFVWLDHHAKAGSEDEAKLLDASMRLMLSHICGRKVEPSGNGSSAAGLAEIKKECWAYLSSLSRAVQSLPTAVSFAAMLEALALYGAGRKFVVPSHANTPVDAHVASDSLVPSGERAYLNELSKHCMGFLRKTWAASSGGMKATDVKVLIEKAIMHSNVSGKAMKPIIAALQVITEFSSEDGSSGSNRASVAAEEGDGFATLTKSTVTVFYRTTFLCLGKLLKEMSLEKKILSGSEEKLAKLAACNKLNQHVKQLIELVKAKKSPVQLKASALREGKVYLELMQRSMPFFGHMAALEAKKTVECLKQVEDGSRILQRLCNQAKEDGAVSLLQLIPAAKKCIEKLVIETCRIVDAAGLSGALKFGALKHKNLKGDVMPSQVSYHGAEVEEEQEEEEEEEKEDADEEDGVVVAAAAARVQDDEFPLDEDDGEMGIANSDE